MLQENKFMYNEYNTNLLSFYYLEFLTNTLKNNNFKHHSHPPADMQFVTNFTRIKCLNNFLPKKRVNYGKLRFPKTQCKLYFHIINIHTQGYITLNKYILSIAIIG